MRALVTGGTGFVGRRLLAKLESPVVLSRDAAKAQKKLGDKFSLPAFHDRILMEGALPLAVLEAQVQQWIDSGGE